MKSFVKTGKTRYRLCPGRHLLVLGSMAVIVLHLLCRTSPAWMGWLSQRLVRPINHLCSRLSALLPFSLAELLIAGLILGFVLCLLGGVYRAATTRKIGTEAYKLLVTGLSMLAAVYAGFCLLWGCYFYDSSFAEKSGLEDGPVSVEQLESVTGYFAALANHYADQVSRDEQGLYTVDRRAVLERAPALYQRMEERFPALNGPEVRVKGVVFSRVLSYLDFTGFYFPITGEANVNMDFPPSLFPATVAHEISHQRGVCREQESNFLAVVSSMESGDPDFCYSACLLAYTHLGNALYRADYEAWEQIYRSLSPAILADFAANRSYWAQFETPVQTVSHTVYENFMYSYDQDLGLRSYGACVDLLVHYYEENAEGSVS